jgi:hypothetical protein
MSQTLKQTLAYVAGAAMIGGSVFGATTVLAGQPTVEVQPTEQTGEMLQSVQPNAAETDVEPTGTVSRPSAPAPAATVGPARRTEEPQVARDDDDEDEDEENEDGQYNDSEYNHGDDDEEAAGA